MIEFIFKDQLSYFDVFLIITLGNLVVNPVFKRIKRWGEKHRGERFYCLECKKKGTLFEFYANKPEIVTTLINDHMERNHFDEPVADQRAQG